MKVWKYGDHVNTDLLFPGKYTYSCSTPEEILPHLFEDLDPEFAGAVRPGDLVMGGINFGCGSSREQPVLGLKAAGVQAVVARSFARIFFRAALNQGLPVIECPQAVDAWREGEAVEVDFAAGRILVGGREFSFPPPAPAVLDLIADGGLLKHVEKKLSRREEG